MRRSGGIRTGPWPGWCSAQPGRPSALAAARPTLPRAMTPPAMLLAISPLRRASQSVRRAPAPGLAALAPRVGGTRLPVWSVADTGPSAGRRLCRSWSHLAQLRPHAARLSVPAHPLRLHAILSNPGILRSSAHMVRLRPHAVGWSPYAVGWSPQAGQANRDVVQWSPHGVLVGSPKTEAAVLPAGDRGLPWL